MAKKRLLKPFIIGVRIPTDLKSKLVNLNEMPEFKFENESKIICRALDHFLTELPEVKPFETQKRDERVGARIPPELKKKLKDLIKTKKYGVESESDVVCLALDHFINAEMSKKILPLLPKETYDIVTQSIYENTVFELARQEYKIVKVKK